MAKAKVSRYYLDTSIFVQIIELDARLKHLVQTRLTSSGKTMASYFSLIEINKRFLSLAINMYETIYDLRDVEAAKIKLSNEYGRTSKYYMIIDALVGRNVIATGGSPGYKFYIAQLEVVIVTLQDEIYSMVSEFKGTFAKHPIVLSRVYKASDFGKHIRVVKDNSVIDYSETWTKYDSELKSVNAYFDSLPKLTRALQREIHELIMKVIADPDFQPNTRFTPSKHIGDLTIGLNAPLGVHILAHDKFYDEYSPAAGKANTFISSIESVTL